MEREQWFIFPTFVHFGEFLAVNVPSKYFFSLRDHFSFYIETKIIIFQKLINKKSIKNDKAINEIANDYEIIITFFIMFIINNLKNTVKW